MSADSPATRIRARSRSGHTWRSCIDDAIADTFPASDSVSISFDPSALGTADDAAAEPTVDDPGAIAHRERSPRG
ncbi:MAG TPA: hypothetical protein VF315_03735, partial [Steroidobacteraceae bacterium]